MLHARLDESYAGDPRSTSHYVVAGFIGTEAQWAYFDELWRESMGQLAILKDGCHASKCATGAKPYLEMLPRQRDEIQHRLIVDIAASKLHACVAISELAGWKARRELFDEFLGKDKKKFNEPHLLAIRQCVLFALDITKDATQEPISFVTDQNKEFYGRVKEWYRMSVDSDALEPELRRRFGPLSEDNRMSTLGLQAADLLAYAAFRHASSNRPSWQWDELVSAKRMSAMKFDEDYWRTIENDLTAKRNEELRAHD